MVVADEVDGIGCSMGQDDLVPTLETNLFGGFETEQMAYSMATSVPDSSNLDLPLVSKVLVMVNPIDEIPLLLLQDVLKDVPVIAVV